MKQLKTTPSCCRRPSSTIIARAANPKNLSKPGFNEPVVANMVSKKLDNNHLRKSKTDKPSASKPVRERYKKHPYGAATRRNHMQYIKEYRVNGKTKASQTKDQDVSVQGFLVSPAKPEGKYPRAHFVHCN